ncbi:MAG: glutamate formimidoyltransferase [Bacillota bacterium]
MGKIIESVINFSEGRDENKIEQIINELKKTEGVKLLDSSYDADHNRCVVTFIGEPKAVGNGAYRLTAKAAELIDMEKHQGGHPRMGATDVIPFVPIFNATMEDCLELAKEVGKKIGNQLEIPVFLYGEAASNPEHTNLANVRRGEFEGLKEKIGTPEKTPDFGPGKIHPSAGAVAVGARKPLVAYNVNLHTDDLRIAKNIANAVREKKGGLKNVKAIGLKLEERNQVQVSMNLVDCEATPIHRVMALIKAEAGRYGVAVAESELIGLSPQEYLIEAACHYLQLNNFNSGQIIENHLLAEEGEEK